MTDGFRNRVKTTAVPMQQSEAGSFRTGVADGLEALGQAGARVVDHQAQLAEIEYRDRTQRENAEVGLALAELNSELAARLDAKQLAPDADMDGYGDALMNEYAERAAKITGQVTSRDAQDSLMRQQAGFAMGLREKAQHFEVVGKVKRTVGLAVRYGDAFINRQRNYGASDGLSTAGDDIALTAQASIYQETLGGAAAEQWLRETRAAGAQSRAGGMIDRGEFAAAAEIIDGDRAVGEWKPDDRDRLAQRLALGERRQQVESERAASQAAAVAAGQADAALDDHRRGVAVDPQILIAEARRTAKDDPARSGRFLAAAAGAQETAVYGNGAASPTQITARLAAIEAQPKWRESPELVARHDTLERLRGETRKAQPNYAPLNFADPAAIRQRVGEMNAWGKSHGGQRWLLSPDQAAELAEHAQSGPQGRAEVAELLSRLPGQSAMVALWQVAPKDGTMRAAIDMPARLRNDVFRGEALRRANPKLTPDGAINAAWGARASAAVAALPAEWQASVKASATNLYAARATGGEEFDDALWDQVVNEVIDPSGRGGIGKHNGAAIVLPDGMDQRELDRRWAGWSNSKGVADRDGRIIEGADVRANFHLVATKDDGWYHLADRRDRFALDGRGERYVVNIRSLTPPAMTPVSGGVPRQAPVYVAPPARPGAVAGPVWFAPPAGKR